MRKVKVNPYPGLFVAIEGLDASGDTTQAALLAGWLKPLFGERLVKLTKEPTNHAVGGLIRDSLQHLYKISPFGLQITFASDRSYHLEQDVEPILAEKGIVVTDRYYFSSFAYGSVGLTLEEQEVVRQVNSQFIHPDVIILLKVPPEECARRQVRSRSQQELFEKTEVLRQVWAAYEELAQEYPNVYIVDGTPAPHVVFSEILRIVASHPKFEKLLREVKID